MGWKVKFHTETTKEYVILESEFLYGEYKGICDFCKHFEKLYLIML